MEIMNDCYQDLLNALKELNKSIQLFDAFTKQEVSDELKNNNFFRHEDLVLAIRDSLINRFAHCVDLFWRYFNNYLEFVVGINLKPKVPRSILRPETHGLCVLQAIVEINLKSENLFNNIASDDFNERIMTEEEVEQSFRMIDCRSKAPYFYNKEAALDIVCQVHCYYDLMNNVFNRIHEKSLFAQKKLIYFDFDKDIKNVTERVDNI